jgi:hypothetical protein
VTELAVDGELLPEPIMEVLIALVGAAGGEVRVSEKWLIDANQYELVVSDDLRTGGRVFRVRRVGVGVEAAPLRCTDSDACPVERHVFQDGYGCRAL